jgi:hypothetical protein
MQFKTKESCPQSMSKVVLIQLGDGSPNNNLSSVVTNFIKSFLRLFNTGS